MVELTLRILFSLLVVVGLVWTLARLVRGPGVRRGAAVAVLARDQLTRGAVVTIVKVADRALVLGVTDHGVNLLTETDLDAILSQSGEQREDQTRLLTAAAPPAGPLAGSVLSPTTWRQAVDVFRDRTVRR